MHIRWPITDVKFLKNILDQGAIGMSLFFMLSGFVLAYRYADGRTGPKDYLVNRFARIYPIYVMAAIITLPWIGITYGSGSFADIAKGLAQVALLIIANIFLIQAWIPQFFGYWNVGGSWSISVEAFCYVFLLLVLPSLARCSLKQLRVIGSVCLLLAVLPGLAAALFNSPASIVFYSLPIFRLPEFLIGTSIYLAIRIGFDNKFGAKPQVFILLIFLVYLGAVGSNMPLYVGHNWIVLPVMAFMILSLSHGEGWIASILGTQVFVWLGKISYSFYSFQALVILGLISYHERLIQVLPALANNRVLATASLAVLIALSAAGYYLIEEPARRRIRRYCKELNS